MSDNKIMTADDVIEIYKMLEENGIHSVIDGGWGIDALLGEQTRQHADLDIAVQYKDVPRLCELFEVRGYKEISRNDSTDYMFVLMDDKGHEVDVHAYTFDVEGNNVYGIPYPYNSLKGNGTINGSQVRCIAVEYVIQFHGNYEPGEKELKDIKALCDKFGLKPPQNYQY